MISSLIAYIMIHDNDDIAMSMVDSRQRWRLSRSSWCGNRDSGVTGLGVSVRLTDLEFLIPLVLYDDTVLVGYFLNDYIY